MTYYHTVAIFAGSSDPVKVTSYTQAEQQDYESGLPVDATVLYSGTSARDMRAAFVGSKSATILSDADLVKRKYDEFNLRYVQRGNSHSHIHSNLEIDLIVNRAYWN